jgi:hypothetical protein
MTTPQKLPTILSLLADAFQLNTDGSCEHLDKWLNTSFPFQTHETLIFDALFEKSKKFVKYWNEEELKMQLVAPLFLLADIDVPEKIKVFYERPLKATINDYSLSVVTDCMVASPMKFNTPRHPYFFLQEYKRGKGDDKDPEAQMLAAMLIAQELNKDNSPLYGSYVVGNEWRFTTLMGQNYCVSSAFTTDEKDDLRQVFFALRQLKNIILDR